MEFKRLMFGLFYRVGFTPWEGHGLPVKLKEVVEGRLAGPTGRALDVGCGTGAMSIYMAQQGWDVTAVDFVEVALNKARAKAAASGVTVSFRRADVTRLRLDLGTTAPFQLLLDGGCFHGLQSADRDLWVREVTALATPDATLILCAFDTGHAPRGSLGTGPEEVERRMTPAWELAGHALDPSVSTEKEHIRVYELRRRISPID